MDSEAPFRKYIGSPESMAWKSVLIWYQIYIYPMETNEKETSVRWTIQNEIYEWLSYSLANKPNFKKWDNLRRTIGKRNPTEKYVT